MTVAQGLGLAPLYRTVPASLTVMQGTDKACVRETIDGFPEIIGNH